MKEMNPWPAYIKERLNFYAELKAESDALLKGVVYVAFEEFTVDIKVVYISKWGYSLNI